MENSSEKPIVRTPKLGERLNVSFFVGTLEIAAELAAEGGFTGSAEWVRALVETEIHRLRPADLARIKGLPGALD